MNRICSHICVSLLAAVGPATQQASSTQRPTGVPELFTPSAWPVGRAMPDAAASPVLVELALLRALEPEDRMILTLSPDEKLLGVVSRIEARSPAQYSVFGRFEHDPDGFFIIVVEEDVAVGHFEIPVIQRAFKLGYVADGVHEIESISGKRFGECVTESEPMAPGLDSAADGYSLAPLCEPEAAGGGMARGGCPAPPRHFDAMIYYTAAARIEAGSENAMNAECQLAVDTTNITYTNSEIPARMVLVFRGETGYGESGDMETDRDRLQDPGDGHMDNVHGERNIFGADFVSLFVSDAGYSGCGIAYCLPGGSSEGFCVVNRDCASGNFSFPHEIGHLQGCAHNREDAGGSGCSYYCDSYGHRFFGDTDAWRTVMSYNDGPGTYTRIGWFSNPLVSFDGVPTGASGDCDVSTNNAGTIFGTTPGREDWRNPRFEVWVNFGEPGSAWEGTYQVPWPTVAQGIAAIYGGAATPPVQPRLIIKAGSTNETPTISKPMRIEACGGTVTIGG